LGDVGRIVRVRASVVSFEPPLYVFGALLIMDHDRKGNGLETFLEHYGFVVAALLAIVMSQVGMFFINLKGERWISFFIAGMVLLISGAALIVYAKIPVYRSGQFFTFGIKSVPTHLAGYYRWGWRVFSFGVVLSLCLLLSRP
jgi:hypothetical protein